MDPENKEINEKDNPSQNPEDLTPNQDLPPQKIKGFKEKIEAFLRPLYMKVLLSTLSLIFFVWGAVTMCSSPPEAIKPRYVIGIDPSWGPLELGNRENNMTAFCETIIHDIAAKLDLRILIQHTTTQQLFIEFEKGKFEGIVSMQLPPPPRYGLAPALITSKPIYQLGPVLVVNEKNPFQNLGEMSGRVVGLVGDARIDINISKYPNVIFSGYQNDTKAFADLNNRKIDGLIVNSLIAKNSIHSLYANKLKITDFTLTNEGIVLILHKTKNTEKIIEQFNKELQKLRENGTYATLLKTWHIQAE